MVRRHSTHRSAGFLFQRYDDGRFLLILRSDKVENPDVWGLPGGGVERGETDLQGALREVREEMGSVPEHNIVGFYPTTHNNHIYVTFHALMDGQVAEDFVPELNWENSEWKWFDIDELPANTHPGVLLVLEELTLAQLDPDFSSSR